MLTTHIPLLDTWEELRPIPLGAKARGHAGTQYGSQRGTNITTPVLYLLYCSPPFTTERITPFPLKALDFLYIVNLKNIKNHTKAGSHCLNIQECEQDQHFESKNKRNEECVGEKNKTNLRFIFLLDGY